MGKKKDHVPIRVGEVHPSVGKVTQQLKSLGFLKADYEQTEPVVTEELLESLTTFRFDSVGNPAPVSIIDEAVLQLFEKKRCGMSHRRLRRFDRHPMQRESPDVPEVGWGRTDLTFAFDSMMHIIGAEIDEVEAKDAIRLAAENWNQACNLNFQETDFSGSPDIVIGAVLEEPSSHPVGNAIAHADYPGVNNMFGGPDEPLVMHFSGKQDWAVGNETSCYDIVRVAMHEFGHCLGLFHYSGTIMQEVLEPEDSNRLLDDELIDRVAQLYRVT